MLILGHTGITLAAAVLLKNKPVGTFFFRDSLSNGNLVCASIGAPEKGLCLYQKWARPAILRTYGQSEDSKDLTC